MKKPRTKQIVCLIGLPCSGKSHAAKLISAKNEGTYISTGDIARSLTTTEQQRAETERQDLFPLEEELRAELTKRIERAPTNLVVIDGFPRSPEQAQFLLDQYWIYLPEIIEINAGDVRTLMTRAWFRSRDHQDSDPQRFERRIQVASQNLSSIYATLRQRLVRTHTIMSAADDVILNQFQKIMRMPK
jgi:adenylate kinase